MNFSQDTDEGNTSIQSYTDEYFVIKQSKFDCHCQLHRSGLAEAWLPADIHSLSLPDFKTLIDCKPDVIIFGSGNGLKFPSNELRKEFNRLNIGLEVMDTGAACRTYNILLSEGRNVAAAILLLSTEL